MSTAAALGVFSAYTDINVLQYYMSLEQPDDRVMCEYIWIDGTGAGLRCKCRTLMFEPKKPEDCPVWMFDGSSTYMSEASNSDIYIYPRAIFRDPFKRGKNKLVLCEVFKYNMEPAETNNRLTCAKVMDLAKESRPWFGIEQEYTLLDFDGCPSGQQKNGDTGPQGAYFLGVGTNKVCGRNIAESHYKACLYAGVKIAGCNSDTLPGQWEFQVGPCEGIEMGDHLWIGRYLLLRISEDFGVNITFDPEPWEGVLMKAKAHCNYSTLAMREKGGMKAIEAAIEKLSKTHVKHIQAYALKKNKDNAGGLTELHDTSNIHGFSAGIADRCASTCIRIPRLVADDGLGYIEDRRPPANCDPYTVTEVIVQTTVLDK